MQIADDIKPNTLLVTLLSALSKLTPTWQIIPTQDIVDIAFKVPEVREQVNIYKYIIIYIHIFTHAKKILKIKL